MAWIHGCKVESHIIRPDGWEIPEDAIKVHGITMERAMNEGEPFAAVVDRFIQDCHDAGLICGHNIHFDTGIIKANILRELGREYYDANDVESALYKGKRIDTMRPTMKWVDAGMANGRLKFPNLSELYAHCFSGETFPAHDALEDVKAVARCLPVILDLGLVELKVKEYPEEQPIEPKFKVGDIIKNKWSVHTKKIVRISDDKCFYVLDDGNPGLFTAPIKDQENWILVEENNAASETAGNGPISHDNSQNNKLHVRPGIMPEIENSPKITAVEHELLEQTDF